MKNLISILIMFVAVGCGETEKANIELPSRELTAEEKKVVGMWVNKLDSASLKYVFLENGTVEYYLIYEEGTNKTNNLGEAKWKVVGKEVHQFAPPRDLLSMRGLASDWNFDTIINKIEPNGELTEIAFIAGTNPAIPVDANGRTVTSGQLPVSIQRMEIPKGEQVTFKKVK